MSFYQKYRPLKLSELDLTSVRESLLSHLTSGLAHSYLFVGPRGTGKTSAARILAQVVNCEKNKDKKQLVEACGECSACVSIRNGSAVDVMEIDAASNGSVDDIRDLRDKVRLSPANLRTKVYIIDEVHMVSLSGFNALLKTLEEPPRDVMFILCTTEAHKVPHTIVSRCMQLNFVMGKISEIVRSLKKVVEGEKLEADEEALTMLAKMADGSFREAHKLLEQVAKMGVKIAPNEVEKVLGFGQGFGAKLLVDAVVAGQNDQIIRLINDAEAKGLRADVFFENLLLELKTRVENLDETNFFGLYSKLIRELLAVADQIKFGKMPFLSIEVVLLQIGLDYGDGPAETREDKMVRSNVSSVRTVKRAQSKLVDKIVEDTRIEVKEEEQTSQKIVVNNPNLNLQQVKDQWIDFINRVSQVNQGLAGLLRSSTPVSIDSGKLVLEVFYQFHKDQIEIDSKKKLIIGEMEKIWGLGGVSCILGQRQEISETTNDGQPVVSMSAEDIFGV